MVGIPEREIYNTERQTDITISFYKIIYTSKKERRTGRKKKKGGREERERGTKKKRKEKLLKINMVSG